MSSETKAGRWAIYVGIVQLHEGLLSAYIEWGLHGDTSEVPSFWWEMFYKVGKGFHRQETLKQKSLKYDCE